MYISSCCFFEVEASFDPKKSFWQHRRQFSPFGQNDLKYLKQAFLSVPARQQEENSRKVVLGDVLDRSSLEQARERNGLYVARCISMYSKFMLLE